MLRSTKPATCLTCERSVGRKSSGGQLFWFIFLLILGIIPGVIYGLVARGKSCAICGLKFKKNHTKHEEKTKEVLAKKKYRDYE